MARNWWEIDLRGYMISEGLVREIQWGDHVFWYPKPSPNVTLASERVTGSYSQDLKYLIVL